MKALFFEPSLRLCTVFALLLTAVFSEMVVVVVVVVVVVSLLFLAHLSGLNSAQSSPYFRGSLLSEYVLQTMVAPARTIIGL